MPKHLWTPDQAKAAAALATAKRVQAAKDRRNGKTAMPQMPEPLPQVPPETYVSQQLSRTRKQIDLVNDMLEDPGVDWKARKALADAKARLYEIEAALAGRPKPGQLRPQAERPRRQVPSDYGPVTPPASPVLPAPAEPPPASPAAPPSPPATP